MGWMTIPENTRYTEFSIDLKLIICPGTTALLEAGRWIILHWKPVCKRKCRSTIHGYAGFREEKETEMVGILSFWDVHCTDASGNQTTIRATRVYPETTDSTEEFGGEGTGAHSLVPYQWEAGHWYRMHLICGTSSETGNTTVEQW